MQIEQIEDKFFNTSTHDAIVVWELLCLESSTNNNIKLISFIHR